MQQPGRVSRLPSNHSCAGPKPAPGPRQVVHKRPPSSCSCHPRSINPPVSSDSSRARSNLIWPLYACRSSRMRQLGIIAVDRLADPSPRTLPLCCLGGRSSPVILSQTPAPIGKHSKMRNPFFPLLKSLPALASPSSVAAAEQRPYFRGRVPTLWFGRSRQRLDIHARGIICVPCGADCADDPFHKTSRSPDKGAVERHPGTLPVHCHRSPPVIQ
jgi:hypothetical protein